MKFRTLIANYRNTIFPFLSCIIFLSLFVFSVSAQSPVLDTEEQAFLKLINDYRVANGLGALQASIVLTTGADWMSGDMSSKNYFSHTDSLGRDPFVRMRSFGYTYNTWLGENIAAGFSDALTTFNQFKNSPTHNSTMLVPEFKVIGIARVTNLSATYRHYWTTDFGGYVDGVFNDAAATVSTVNAANYTASVAPDSIAATFGTNLANGVYAATNLPLPQSLGGTTVTVNGVLASLLYVSPTQINYLVPGSLGAGTVAVEVKLNGASVGKGNAAIGNVAPSLFTISADGKGVPAGYATFDNKSFQQLFNADGSSRPVAAGSVQAPNYLVLFGTGFRKRSAVSNVQVTIGGIQAQIDYAGSQNFYAGVDQLNLIVPPTARLSGEVNLVLYVDGLQANTVRVNIGN